MFTMISITPNNDIKYNQSEKVMSRLDVTDVKRIGMGDFKLKDKFYYEYRTKK